MILFVEYAGCSTCRKAKAWLDAQGARYTDRPIREQNPSYEELKAWHEKIGLPLRKFFNTSGQLYRSLALKDRLPDMSEEEQLRLLASDGMLVKRPLLVGADYVLVGFRPEAWAQALDEAR